MPGDPRLPEGSRHAFLEVALPDGARIFGVHLSAVHAAWTESRRVRELRALHGDAISGFTFPTWSPHVRLDYVFAPSGYTSRFTSCEVYAHDEARAASDHYPLVAEWK